MAHCHTKWGGGEKIIIAAIKVHIFAPSPSFYCVALEKRAECLFK